MKKWLVNIIVVFLTWLSLCAYSQKDCIDPLPPLLTSVSVQPETGFTELNWTLSPSPDIYAYVVYIYYNENGISRGDSIDILLDPASTNYLYTSRVAEYFSESYTIASRAKPYCRSKFSNIINSIFAVAKVDTCNKKMVITWNSYPSFPKKVIDYSILFSVNGGSFAEGGKEASDKNSFILSNFISDADYCFVVKANLDDGTFSTSNKACLSTKMQRPPDWINADYATVDEKDYINLSFSVDPLSEINSFRLERKIENENDFSLITKIESVSGHVMFTDKTADPFKRNYYRLLAVNNCANAVVSSNLSSNIVPKLVTNKNIISLTWDSYRFWLGKVSGYKLFIDTGGGFHEESSISPADTAITLDYSSVMYNMTGSNLCFYISAFETSNPYGISGETGSSRICMDIIENITVPNAFTPNNDLTNDLFRPVLSFIPADYHLVITDRKNKILFESQDHMAEWDGKLNGESLPQGVYLWFLKIKTPSGKQMSRSGTIAIIR